LTIKPVEGVRVDLQAWMNEDPEASFENWRKKLPKIAPTTGSESTTKCKESNGTVKKDLSSSSKKSAKAVKEKEKCKVEMKQNYLINKYGRRWIEKFYKVESDSVITFNSQELLWLKKLLFCPGSVQTRSVTAALLKDLAHLPERRLKVLIYY
jgi:hypothetical protein